MEALQDEFQLATNFKLRAIVPLEEIANGDMIYIAHRLKTGDDVRLIPDGTNLRGDLRMKVFYHQFLLGSVTIGGVLKEFYEGRAEVWAQLGTFEQKKHGPVQSMQIALQALELKKVS